MNLNVFPGMLLETTFLIVNNTLNEHCIFWRMENNVNEYGKTLL